MSKAPERIWAFAPDIFDNCSLWQDMPSPAGDTIEYVRADRIEELEKRNASLEAKLAKQEALMAAGFAEYERRLAKAVEALGVLADDTNWFDAVEEDGTFSPAWRGTGSPDEIARATLAELSSVSCANTTGGKDE